MSLFGSIASVAGGLIQGGAEYLGAREQAKAADRAGDRSDAEIQLAREIYEQERKDYQQQRKDLAPYRQVGQQSVNRLRDTYLTGSRPYQTSPGYQFRMDEGTKALERGAAARGRQFSGAQGKALQRYGQDYATADYDQNFNRLATLAGYGPSVQQPAFTGGQNYFANIAAGNTAATNAAKTAAAARRSGYESIGSGVNTTLNNLLTVHGRDWF